MDLILGTHICRVQNDVLACVQFPASHDFCSLRTEEMVPKKVVCFCLKDNFCIVVRLI